MPNVGRKAAPGKSHTQSVIFDKAKWDVARAKKWLAEHDYYTDGLDPGAADAPSLRFRQFDPDAEAFRYRVKEIEPGISLVLGFPATAAQALFAAAAFAETGLQWAHDEATDTWSVTDVPLFAPGDWNGGKYDRKWCAELVERTNAAWDLIRPRLGIGHPPKSMTDEDDIQSWRQQQPRMGLIGKLKMIGERVFAETISKIPAWLKKRIDSGEWGPMSIEAKRIAQGWVLDHVALLGLAAPAVPWAGVDAFSESAEERLVFVLGSEPEIPEHVIGNADDLHIAKTPATQAGARGNEMDEKELEAREKRLADERAALDRLTESAKAERENVAEERRRLHASRVDGMWREIVTGNHAKPAEENLFKQVANTLSGTDRIKFADESGKEVEGTALDAHYASWMARTLPVKKTAGATPEDDNRDGSTFFAEEADKLMTANPRLSFGEALEQIERKNPEKYAAYRAERFQPMRKEAQ